MPGKHELGQTTLLVPGDAGQSTSAVHCALVAFVSTVWISVTLFSAYIFARYAGTWLRVQEPDG